MTLTISNLKRWYLMLTGKSIYHVKQDSGKIYSTTEIRGYYNDLTQKVLQDKDLLDKVDIPRYELNGVKNVEFPTAIFQYGLGAYDLFLINYADLDLSDLYIQKVLFCSEWALKKQGSNGAWNNFFFIYPDAPYSAMAQGEGISLLLRAYRYTKDERYFSAAVKAVDFLLLDVKHGGVARYDEDGVVLLEYTNRPAVLNGWIFALFGFYDMVLVSDNKKYEDIWKLCIETLKKRLDDYDCGYWSMYDEDWHICSPFYHNLQVAQMEVMYTLTNLKEFHSKNLQWHTYQKSLIKQMRAFTKKAVQKIRE